MSKKSHFLITMSIEMVWEVYKIKIAEMFLNKAHRALGWIPSTTYTRPGAHAVTPVLRRWRQGDQEVQSGHLLHRTQPYPGLQKTPSLKQTNKQQTEFSNLESSQVKTIVIFYPKYERPVYWAVKAFKEKKPTPVSHYSSITFRCFNCTTVK